MTWIRVPLYWRDVPMRDLNAPIVTHDPANPPEDERERCPHGVILEDTVCWVCEPNFPAPPPKGDTDG